MNPFLISSHLKRLGSIVYMCQIVASDSDEEMDRALFQVYSEIRDLSDQIESYRLHELHTAA